MNGVRARNGARMVGLSIVVAVAALAVACGNDDDGDSGPPNGELSGGVLATFVVSDQQFRVWVTNDDTIAQLEALAAGESMANIPNGRIHHGPGEADHNAPWSWHLDPEDIEMAEITTEVCDGEPSYVEDNVDEFVDNVQRYCPWAAELVELEDLR